MDEELPKPSERKEQVDIPALVDMHVDRLQMPQSVGESFRARWVKDKESKVAPYADIEDDIKTSADECHKIRVDVGRTGLELEIALKERIAGGLIDKASEFNGVIENAQSFSEITAYLSRTLAEDQKVTFIIGYNTWYQQQEKGVPADEQITQDEFLDFCMGLVLVSEEAQYGFISGDLQKLKACNDFGSSQIDGIDGEKYVDMFGFSELGRRLQALNESVNGGEYALPLNGLEGKQRHDPLNNFTKVDMSKDVYLDYINNNCDQEDLEYCRVNGINILPAAKRPAGDEFTFLIHKARGENGESRPLTQEDMDRAERLIKQISEVNIGVFTEEDSAFKRDRARAIFGDRLTMSESPLEIGFSLRLGSQNRSDSFFSRDAPQTEVIQQIDDPVEQNKKMIELTIENGLADATQKMESNKREETMNGLFDALNGDPNAQLLMILLIEQSRFPGDVNKLKDLLVEYQGQEITREIFNEKFVPALERRSEDDRNKPKYRFSRDILD